MSSKVPEDVLAALSSMSNAEFLEEMKRRGVEGLYKVERLVMASRKSCIDRIINDMIAKGEGKVTQNCIGGFAGSPSSSSPHSLTHALSLFLSLSHTLTL